MVPEIAAGSTLITNVPDVEDGHGLFETTALKAVVVVKAPVIKLDVVPVTLVHVGFKLFQLVDRCHPIVPEEPTKAKLALELAQIVEVKLLILPATVGSLGVIAKATDVAFVVHVPLVTTTRTQVLVVMLSND